MKIVGGLKKAAQPEQSCLSVVIMHLLMVLALSLSMETLKQFGLKVLVLNCFHPELQAIFSFLAWIWLTCKLQCLLLTGVVFKVLHGHKNFIAVTFVFQEAKIIISFRILFFFSLFSFFTTFRRSFIVLRLLTTTLELLLSSF